MQLRGPGDYLVATPTFPLLELKALPEFRRLFEDMLALGRYVGSPTRAFTLSESGQRRLFGNSGKSLVTRVLFGYAAEPESLESATIKAACLDEAGQKRFKLGAWEAILRRLSIHQGRALITTTIYNLGWLKQQVYDRWLAGDQDYEVVNFPSVENPAFPREEYERARANLPRWKFDMFYRAIFTRPAGLIYDAFDEKLHRCPRFAIPDGWERYVGIDFGGVHTAAVFYARDPQSGKLYAYREYLAGGRTAREHVAEIIRDPFSRREIRPVVVVGGSKSEGQWRQEFRAAGLAVREPRLSEIEVGIDRVYGFHKRNELLVFADLSGYLDQKLSYSRALDEAGNSTAEIEDKESYHFMDAERYILGYLSPGAEGWTSWVKERMMQEARDND